MRDFMGKVNRRARNAGSIERDHQLPSEGLQNLGSLSPMYPIISNGRRSTDLQSWMRTISGEAVLVGGSDVVRKAAQPEAITGLDGPEKPHRKVSHVSDDEIFLERTFSSKSQPLALSCRLPGMIGLRIC